jgi:hypothetical protein
LDLIASALAEDPKLARYTGFVEDSGEGRWTIQAAIEEAVPAEVLSAALYARFRSRHDHTFGEKVLSAMREKFGGHREGRYPRIRGWCGIRLWPRRNTVVGSPAPAGVGQLPPVQLCPRDADESLRGNSV